ncbi:MAG: tetratricopeptide repeat protein [Endomicrobium sp.]|nr:tetratricopeptide repeat protein [Endomicrobium sp.]
MKRYGFLLVYFIFMALTVGCVPLNSSVITDLRGEVSQLQIQYRELWQDHVDLYAKVDSAYVTLDVLNALIQDLQNKISVLKQTIHDFKITSSKKSKSGRSVMPSSLYQNAYSDYSMGKFDLAYSGFQSFTDKYPNAELAPQSQFYMGECFYSMSMWEKALEEYRKVEQHYNKSSLVPSARLKVALCCEALGKNDEAADIFSSILKDFPQSPESLTAKEKIKIRNDK